MKTKVIRTNEKCDKCTGFLIFIVKNEHHDSSGNETQRGLWQCTLCETTRIGMLIRNYNMKVTDIAAS